MASEFGAPRDGIGQSSTLLPPGEKPIEISECNQSGTPRDNAGSFLYDVPCTAGVDWAERELPHDALLTNGVYLDYMRMPKGVADPTGARQLARVYRQLKDETQPGYLQVAGWAAAEVALGCSYLSTGARLGALHTAQRVWERGLAVQTHWEQNGFSQNIGRMHRLALDLAILPLLRGVVAGNVTEAVCRQAFADCLGVAESNMRYLQAARARGDHSAAAAHAGLAYECNALLAHNRKLSSTWFVIPAMARCDSGYYHWRETHDLLVVHQKYGQLISITPVEIKAKASLRDRRRYKALLVRGKMHLSVPGKSQPEHTLNAIAAMHAGTANQEDIRIANTATDRFSDMIRDYYAGTVLGDVAMAGSVTVFHDNKQVAARHPGLALAA